MYNYLTVSDFKKKVEHFIKKMFRGDFAQLILANIIAFYMKLVFKTSRVVINNKERYTGLLKKEKGCFVVAWHGRMFIAPTILSSINNEIGYNRKMFFLASKHQDGQIAGKVMKVFGFDEIYGSTMNKDDKDKLRQANNMGAVVSVRKIMKELKNNNVICLPPDGPRGPFEQINGEVIAIAKKMDVEILPAVVSYSFKIRLKSWDKFQIPLPFGRVLIEFSIPITIADYEDLEKAKNMLKQRMTDFSC